MRALAVALVGLLLVGGLQAAPKKPAKKTARSKFVLLVRRDDSIPASWLTELQQIGRAAVQESDNLLWLAPPEVSLDETKVLLGCQAWDGVCIAQIASTLGAERALYAELVHGETGPRLTLLAVEPKGPGPARELALPDAKETGLRVAQLWVRHAILGTTPTFVVVRTSEPGAALALDGKPWGIAPLVLTDDLPLGEHTVRVTLKGFAPTVSKVVIEPGQSSELLLTLEPEARVVEATPTSAPVPAPTTVVAQAARAPFWGSPVALTGLGLGAAAMVGAATLYGAHLLLAQSLIKDTEGWEKNKTITSTKQVDYVPAYQQAVALYISMWIVLGVGTAFGATGAAFLFIPPPGQ